MSIKWAENDNPNIRKISHLQAKKKNKKSVESKK